MCHLYLYYPPNVSKIMITMKEVIQQHQRWKKMTFLHYVSHVTHIQYMIKTNKIALKYITYKWKGYGNGSGSYLLCSMGLCVQYQQPCFDSSLTGLLTLFGFTVSSTLKYLQLWCFNV